MKNYSDNGSTFSGIKSLRKLDNHVKPLHLSFFSAVCDLVAFISRMAKCNPQMNIAPATGEAKAVRTVMNEVGKWVPVKD